MLETRFRRIVTELPVPESAAILETLRRIEPDAAGGLAPVVWDRAESFQVYDRWGNQWLDWSSGVLVANAGHGRREIVEAIASQVNASLLTAFCFPTEIRARFLTKLESVLPEPLRKILLLTTGAETVECAIKLTRAWGVRRGGRGKHAIVSFDNAFHGRTLGAQQAGGIPALKEWIVNTDPGFVQLPFPQGSFDQFEAALHDRGIASANVAGVIMETYQGGSAAFAPMAYMRSLREWCSAHRALLTLDEVQAGFGRCGTMWGFERYGIVPDLACFGKGISSSLPISALAGRPDAMELFPPMSMTTTHSGNPLSCAAALASLELIVGEDLPGNAKRVGAVLHAELSRLQSRFREIERVEGCGLVAGVACRTGELARAVVERCFEKGLLMFTPVGPAGATIKICPPLTITEDALHDGLTAFTEAFEETCRKTS